MSHSPRPRRRLLFVTKTSVLGGTEKHLIDVLAGLDLSRVEPIVLCLGDDVYREPLKHVAAGAVRVEVSVEPSGWLGYWNLFARFRPAVIVFVNGQLGLFPASAYLVGRLGGKRRVVGIEHLLADVAPAPVGGRGLVGRLRSACGWRARHMARLRLAGTLSHWTICVSDAVRERLVTQYAYPPARTVTVVNGINVDHYGGASDPDRPLRLELGIAAGIPVVLCVASLVRQKRVDLLLEALARLKAAGTPCVCVIAGEGPLRTALTEQACRLELAGCVRFVGFVKDIRPYLQASDLFVMSSDKEGLPLALLEAMASGLPCIATDVGGNREAILHGESGLLVEAGSADALADAMRYGLTQDAAMRTMGANGRDRIRRRFRVEETVRRVAAIVCG